MITLVLIVCTLQLFGSVHCKSNSSADTNKDMYVIHAMAYQVGILTNKTDNDAPNATMGNQEAITFFRTNGSKVDLSSIPAPLVTNVTAQSMIQVAPKPLAGAKQQGPQSQIAWSALKDLASLPQSSPTLKTEKAGLNIARRSAFDIDLADLTVDSEPVDKRSINELKELLKREAPDDKVNVKVVKGAAVIPQGASVQSIAIPPLIALNNNLSDIPVPIPNTSVVHYAKINTLIRKP